MRDEEYYRYYRLAGPVAMKINADYQSIEADRQAALDAMLKASGAVGFIPRRGWGEYGSLVEALAFPADTTFPVPVIIQQQGELSGQSVVVVRGDARASTGRTADAKAFNAEHQGHITAANELLAKAPCYQDYLIDHFQVKCCTIGGPSPRRPSASKMISTYCGTARLDKDVLLFAIPNAAGGDAQPEVPPLFEEITYGQFYDLTH